MKQKVELYGSKKLNLNIRATGKSLLIERKIVTKTQKFPDCELFNNKLY